MAEAVIQKVSPLGTASAAKRLPNFRSETGVSLTPRLMTALVQVQAWPDRATEVAALIDTFAGSDVLLTAGASAAEEGQIVMNTGPARVLIDSTDPGLPARLAGEIAASDAAITPLTHGRIAIRIEGPKAAFLLMKGVNIDLDPAEAPVGAVLLSGIHGMSVTIRRTAVDGFDVYVLTSFARALMHWLVDAASDCGVIIRETEGS